MGMKRKVIQNDDHKQQAGDEDDSEPFNLFKIPKKKEKMQSETKNKKNESLQIAADSDDDSDDEQIQQKIQKAKQRDLAERQRRIKEKKEKDAIDAIRREKERKQQIEMEKMKKQKLAQMQKKKQIEKEQQIKIAKEKQLRIEKQSKLKTAENQKPHQNIPPTTIPKKKKSRLKITFSGSKKSKLKSQRQSSVLSDMSIASNSTTTSTVRAPLPAPSTIMTTQKTKKPRPEIERIVQFGDHYLKQQRALNSYHKFKRTQSGKVFENEDLLRTYYGVSATEMIQNETYSHRLIPYAFEKSQFVNLPEQYSTFSTKLFEIASKEKSKQTENNKIKLRFCQYSKQYNDEYFVLNPDYSHRQNHPEIDADFDGAKWIKMWYDFKDECIRNKFFKLFQPFDPDANSHDVAFPALKLWRKENPITFHQIEQKLLGAMYTSNDSVKRDVQIAFDNLQDIYHENETYRCFIDKLRQKWILHKTDRVNQSNEEHKNDEIDRQKLAERYSEFETSEDCIAYYFNQKTEEQKKKKC